MLRYGSGCGAGVVCGGGGGGGLGCIMLTVGQGVYVRRRMARKGREHIY